MGKRQKQESWIRNTQAYLHYYYYFKNMALNMYKWENLPPTVDERFLELTLFEKGYGLYFRDEVIGDLFLTCTIGGRLDVYRIPITYKAYSSNGYLANRTKDDSVLMFSNFSHIPLQSSVDFFAMKLYDIDRTIDVNLRAQKTPVLLTCDESEKLSLENAYAQFDGNSPVIKTYDSFNKEGLGVLKTDAPYLVDKLIADKNKLWNEAMTFLGISNANTEKKERMITDEVEANDGQIAMSAEIGLSARRQACEVINRMFGTEIWVNPNKLMDGKVNRKESEESERIHDTTEVDN